MSARRILMAGLPEAGKTTFLAAMWHQLESREIATRLTLTKEPAERKYLNDNAKRWVRSEPLLHTPSGTAELIRLELADQRQKPLILEVPDLPGEVFRDMWKKRAWSPIVKQLASEASGVIFFVRANHITAPVRVDQEVAAALEAGLPAPADGTQDPARLRVSDMVNSPSAAQVAHILQAIRDEAPGKVMRLALVISAWDAAVSATPDAWLKKNLTLVDQYLGSSTDRISHRIFGVSAQGGNVRDAKTRAELVAKPNPSTRVQVVDEQDKDHDLTRVLEWVGGMD